MVAIVALWIGTDHFNVKRKNWSGYMLGPTAVLLALKSTHT